MLNKLNAAQTAPISYQTFTGETNRLALLLEAAPVALAAADEAGRLLFANLKFEELFGYGRTELVGQPVELLIPPAFREEHIHHRTNFIDQPRTRPMGSGMNLVARRKDGSEFPVEVGLGYETIEQQTVVIFSVIDISIRKEVADLLEQRVQARTRELERRRQVADGLRDILTVLNSNRSLEEILDHIVHQAVTLLEQASACAIYRLHEHERQFVIKTSWGLPADYAPQANLPLDEEFIGQAVLTRQPVIFSAADQGQKLSPPIRAYWQALIDSGFCTFLAVPLVIKEEIYGSLVLYYRTPVEFSREVLDLAVTFSDQAALAIENARLRNQVEQAAVVAERSRLARDLHDAVTQTLFSASLIAEVLPRLWQRNPPEAERRLEELRQLTRGALAEMRTLLLELRPSKLIDVPLSDLLRQLTEAITGRSRVPITFSVSGGRPLPPDVQVAFYRIAQEALNNVAKHARASQAEVWLDCQVKVVKLSIKDNGRGFRFAGVAPENLGLNIMHERAEAIGAELAIQTELGQGTQVTVEWRPPAAG